MPQPPAHQAAGRIALEGTPAISVNLALQAWFLDRLRQEVDLSARACRIGGMELAEINLDGNSGAG